MIDERPARMIDERIYSVEEVARCNSQIQFEYEDWHLDEVQWWIGEPSKFTLCRPRKRGETCGNCQWCHGRTEAIHVSIHYEIQCTRPLRRSILVDPNQIFKRDHRGVFYMCESNPKRLWHVIGSGSLVATGFTTYNAAEHEAKSRARQDMGKQFQIVMTCAIVAASDVHVEKL